MLIIKKKKQSKSNKLPKAIRAKTQIHKAYKTYTQNQTSQTSQISQTSQTSQNNQTASLKSLNERLLSEAIEAKVNDLIEVKHNVFYRVIKLTPIYGYRTKNGDREIVKLHLEAGKLIIKSAIATVQEIEDCGFTMLELIEHIVKKGGKIVKPDAKFLESL